MTKILIILLSTLLILSCVNKDKSSSYSSKKGKHNKNKNIPIKIIKIKTIVPHNIIKIKSYNSILKPQKDIFLVAQSSGIITTLSFDMGTTVKKGQLLAVIDTSLKKIDLDLKKVIKEEAQHQLKYVKSLLEKDKILLKKNIINQETFDASKNRVILAGFAFKKASIAYNIAKNNYDKSFVYAPFDGIITTRNKQKGDIVTIGTPIGRIIDNKNFEAIIGVTWEDLLVIKSYNKNNKIEVISPDKTKCDASIIGISESTEPITKLYPIKLTISNCDLINETQVKIKIPLKEYKNAFEIKRDILKLEDNNYYLFLLENNKAIKTKVKLLNDNNNGNMIISIKSNKKEYKIIKDGHIGLKNNQTVKIMENK